jgi:sugar phosphate isomerase/epimerase
MILSTSTNICAFRSDGSRNPLEFCIAECARAGYTILDINFCEAMNPYSRMKNDDWEDYVNDIARMGEQWGVVFTQSHLPYYDVYGTSDEAFKIHMEEMIRRSIIASGMLGIRWAVTHPATFYAAGPHARLSLEKNLEYYAPHVVTAKQAGTGIALENDFEYKKEPYQRVYGSSIPELVELVDAFHDDSVGLCYDFGHANLTGGFHRQNLKLIGHRLSATHVQDNLGFNDDHFMPFYGKIDWENAMAGLAEIDYQGDLTYEIQEFGRYLPNDMKHLVVEQSIVIGNVLIGMFEDAKNTRVNTSNTDRG